MYDMITIFNQLTQSELADCNKFENILQFHYEKFKFFYKLIKKVELEDIKDISCIEYEKKLTINIKFKNKKTRDNFFTSLNDYVDNDDIYFSVLIEKNKNNLNISIENKTICMEDDIYENFFNTD